MTTILYKIPLLIPHGNTHTILCKLPIGICKILFHHKECLNRFLQMRVQRYKIIYNPPNKIAKLNIFLFKVRKILAGGSVIV